ncbi:hypothetical protein D3C85_1594300 [compost metagenome]
MDRCDGVVLNNLGFFQGSNDAALCGVGGTAQRDRLGPATIDDRNKENIAVFIPHNDFIPDSVQLVRIHSCTSINKSLLQAESLMLIDNVANSNYFIVSYRC